MRFLRSGWNFSLGLGAFLLATGCAGPREKAPSAAPAVTPVVPVVLKAEENPVRSATRSAPSVPAPSPTPSAKAPKRGLGWVPVSAAPSRPAAKKLRVEEFIKKGKVESISREEIVVAPLGAPKESTSSLFEDAIIQNQVRAAVKAAGQGSAVADTVRVNSGAVSLDLGPVADAALAAAALDAALGADGVVKVRASYREE